MAGCRTSFGEVVEIGFEEQNLKEYSRRLGAQGGANNASLELTHPQKRAGHEDLLGAVGIALLQGTPP